MNKNISVRFKKNRRNHCTHLLLSVPLNNPLGWVDIPPGKAVQTSIFDETTAILTCGDIKLSVMKSQGLSNPEAIYMVVERQMEPEF